MSRGRQYNKRIHPKLHDIEKEVWWQIRGQVEQITFKRLPDGDWRCTITAVNKKGDKYYASVVTNSIETSLELMETFLKTGNPSIAKWRASNF